MNRLGEFEFDFGGNKFLFDFTYRWTKLRISRTYVFSIGTEGLTKKKMYYNNNNKKLEFINMIFLKKI